MDQITSMFHQLHGEKRNFYAIQGFRAGWNNRQKSLEFTLADSALPAETKQLYAAMFKSGKEASTKV